MGALFTPDYRKRNQLRVNQSAGISLAGTQRENSLRNIGIYGRNM